MNLSQPVFFLRLFGNEILWIRFSTSRMFFLSPNQQCGSTEVNKNHSVQPLAWLQPFFTSFTTGLLTGGSLLPSRQDPLVLWRIGVYIKHHETCYNSNEDVVTTRLESRSTKLQLLVNVEHFTRNDKMLGLKLSRDHTQYSHTNVPQLASERNAELYT